MRDKKIGMRLAKRCCAAALTVVMATLAPLQTFAATGRTTYISELKMAYGEKEDEARKWLESDGYTVIDCDFNKDHNKLSLSGIYNEDKAVMLGYKTTKDPKKAITDIKAMNMTGGYNFDDYQKLLDKEKDDIALFLEDFNCTLNEYRENYKNNVTKALIAHDNLNMLYDDDTEQSLGDLLLQETKQEMGEEAYNALSDDEKKNHADMVTILMQANGKAVLSIEQNLYYGADTDTEGSFLDRLIAIGNYEAFEKEFKSGFPKSTSVNEIDAKMDVTYGDTAAALADKLPSLQDYMRTYTEHELFGEEDEAKIEAYFETEEEEEKLDIVFWKNAKNLYLSLQQIPYEDGSLYDFLMDEEYDLAGEDQYLLYPMASVLSPGQIACLPYVSFVQMFNGAVVDENGFQQLHDGMKTSLGEDSMKASIYEGINRTIFGATSVALTTDARALTNSSTHGYQENWMGWPITNLTTVLACAAVVSAISSGLSFYIDHRITKKAVEAQLGYIEKPTNTNNISSQVVTDVMDDASSVISDDVSFVSSVSSDSLDELIIEGKAYKLPKEQFDQKYSSRACSPVAKYIGYAFCAAAIIMGTISIVRSYNELKEYYRQERTPIPQYMVDSTTGDGKIKNFTYYTAVTCNRMEVGFDTSDIAKERSILANFGDLKGDVGKEWLALYYTKNSAAGHPITTDLLIQSGSSNLKTDYHPVSMFGSKALLNLNDEQFCYGSADGLYMMFKTDDTANLAGSTFSSSNAMILAVLGAVLGFSVTVIVYRRKEKEGEVA